MDILKMYLKNLQILFHFPLLMKSNSNSIKIQIQKIQSNSNLQILFSLRNINFFVRHCVISFLSPLRIKLLNFPIITFKVKVAALVGYMFINTQDTKNKHHCMVVSRIKTQKANNTEKSRNQQ